jgi:hypothetical protein
MTNVNDLNLGMCLFSTSDTSLFDSYVDNLIKNNFNHFRIDIPTYSNTSWLNQSKAAVLRAISKGAKVTWGVSNIGGDTLTAANWADYEAAVLAAAAWSQIHGVYEFQLGNEEESNNDNTTLTDAQLIINLKALATAVQVIYTIGNVSYSTSKQDLWIVAGKGDLDLLCVNIYRGGITFDDTWKTLIDDMVTAFSINGFYLTEFNLSYTSLDSYTTDEDIQAIGIVEMIDYIKSKGIIRANFFQYSSDLSGVCKSNGVYRKLWDVLKITNDWKRRKTSGQSGLGGISNGKYNR